MAGRSASAAEDPDRPRAAARRSCSPPYTVVLGAFARSGNTATYSGGSCVSVVMSWIGGLGGPRRKRPGMPMRTTPTRRLIAASEMPRRASFGRASVTTRPISDTTAAAIPPYAPHLRRVSKATRSGRMPSRYPTGPARSTSAEATARPAPSRTTHEMEGFSIVCAMCTLSHIVSPSTRARTAGGAAASQARV